MSILLDALKRAEQEKQAKQGTSAPAPPPLPAPTPAAAKLELEGMSTPLAAERPAPQPDRDAVKGVFTAKQSGAKSGKAPNVAIIAAIVVLVVAAGAYFVWEWTRPVAPAASTPRPPTLASQLSQPGAPAAVQAAKPAESATNVGGAPPNVASSPALIVPEAPKARPQPQAAEAAVMSLLRESGTPSPSPPLKMSRSIDPPRVNADVALGYDALRRGDFPEARRRYEAAQAAEPLSVDAQLGLGTIAARSGDRAAADRHFRHALEIDPKNPAALAGLAAMADNKAAPEQLEAQLRNDLQRYPYSSALQMALGNLYASQNRWTEAQPQFFEAFRLDPENADAAYNLAVSLDHLGQARLALDYYQRSLAAAQKQGVQFDRNLVKRRIEELRP